MTRARTPEALQTTDSEEDSLVWIQQKPHRRNISIKSSLLKFAAFDTGPSISTLRRRRSQLQQWDFGLSWFSLIEVPNTGHHEKAQIIRPAPRIMTNSTVGCESLSSGVNRDKQYR